MRSIVIGVAFVFGCVAGCSSNGKGDSETHWLTCDTDDQCPSGQICVAKQCAPSDGSARTSSGGSVATGGSSGATSTGGGASSSGGAGGSGEPDGSSGSSSTGGSSGSGAVDGGGLSSDSGTPGDAATRDATSVLACTAAGASSFGAPEPVGGTGYSDTGAFGDPEGKIAVAGDGTAFATWASSDSTSTHAYAHASRYTPSGGWEPHLQFEEYEQKGIYGGSVPAVAASANGDAMVLWWHASGVDGAVSYEVMAMRYSSGWESPVRIQGPTTNAPAALATVAADAHGNFVAAGIEEMGPNAGTVNMARYTRGSGWGPIESAPPTGTSGAPAEGYGLKVLMSPAGHALVTWSQGFGKTGPKSIGAERFDPNTGWSGKEILVEGVLGQTGVSTPFGAIGDDGTAAVTWTQEAPGMMRAMVRTFSGSWSQTTNLDGMTTGGTIYSPSIATDSHGTFIVVWDEQDPQGNQVYASRMTPAGAWSQKTLLNTPEGLPDGAPKGFGQLAPFVAMSRTGDAVVSLSQWITFNTYSIDAVTYSPSTGWSTPARLDGNFFNMPPPVMDDCGNATLVWLRQDTFDVKAARHEHGGGWTSPSRLGSAASTLYPRVALGMSSNGEAIATFRSQDDHGLSASVAR